MRTKSKINKTFEHDVKRKPTTRIKIVSVLSVHVHDGDDGMRSTCLVSYRFIRFTCPFGVRFNYLMDLYAVCEPRPPPPPPPRREEIKITTESCWSLTLNEQLTSILYYCGTYISSAVVCHGSDYTIVLGATSTYLYCCFDFVLIVRHSDVKRLA